MVVFLEEIVGLVVEGAIRGITAQTGGATGGLKAQAEQRAASQIAAGTAIPIPPDRLAAFEKATLPFPLTGQARRFAFLGPGSTLSTAQLVALGVLAAATPTTRFGVHFTSQPGSRSVPLDQIVSRGSTGSSLSERLRQRDGNLRRTLLSGRRNWRELLTSRAPA